MSAKDHHRSTRNNEVTGKMNLDQVFKSYSSESDFIAAVNAELIKLCEENPEFVYAETSESVCSYCGPATCFDLKQIGPDCNGCIFGQALQKLGWDDKDELTFVGSIATLLNDLVTSYIVSTPSYWLEIQGRQDSGTKWGYLRKYIP